MTSNTKCCYDWGTLYVSGDEAFCRELEYCRYVMNYGQEEWDKFQRMVRGIDISIAMEWFE